MGKATLKVRLLRYTPTPEELVAMGAKLCYSSVGIDALEEKISQADQSGFLQKLASLGHLSPVEHAVFTFAIEGVSRSLLTQITRHRIASFSVQSQRYVQAGGGGNTFGYIVPPSIESLGAEAVAKFEKQMETLQRWYDEWIEALGSGEKANQDARFVLPNAAETKFMVTMNARELMHFFRLRCCNRAQWEIHALADEMLRLAKEVAPTLFAQAGPGCVDGPCPEGKMTCGQLEAVRRKYRDI